MANAAVVLLLLVATFRKRLFWQEATLILLFFVGFFFWLSFENHLSRSCNNNASAARALRVAMKQALPPLWATRS